MPDEGVQPLIDWFQRMAVLSELASGRRFLIVDAENENELVEVIGLAEGFAERPASKELKDG